MKTTNGTSRQGIATGVLAVCMVMVAAAVIGAVSASKLTALGNVARSTASATPTDLARVQRIRTESLASDELLLRHMLANNLAEKNAIEAEIGESARRLDEGLHACEPIIETASERRLFATLSDALARVRHLRNDHLLPLSRAGHIDEARLVYETDMATAQASYRSALSQMLVLTDQKTRSHSRELGADVQANAWALGSGALLTTIFAGVIAALIRGPEWVSAASKAQASAPQPPRTTPDAADALAASREMVEVLKVLDDIAIEANVIALNAAVEAARAGVPGIDTNGLAADIRRLSERPVGEHSAARALSVDAPPVARTLSGPRDQSGSTLSMEAVRAIAANVADLKRMIHEIAVA